MGASPPDSRPSHHCEGQRRACPPTQGLLTGAWRLVLQHERVKGRPRWPVSEEAQPQQTNWEAGTPQEIDKLGRRKRPGRCNTLETMRPPGRTTGTLPWCLNAAPASATSYGPAWRMAAGSGRVTRTKRAGEPTSIKSCESQSTKLSTEVGRSRTSLTKQKKKTKVQVGRKKERRETKIEGLIQKVKHLNMFSRKKVHRKE